MLLLVPVGTTVMTDHRRVVFKIHVSKLLLMTVFCVESKFLKSV